MPVDAPRPDRVQRTAARPWAKLLVVLLTAYACAVIAPDTLRVVQADYWLPPLAAWYPLGTLGLQADNDGRVTAVDAGSPADRAGIRVDDRIVLDAPNTDRRAVNQFVFVSFREPITLRVATGGQTRDVLLDPEPEELTALERISLFVAQLSGFFFILLCASLIWQHPSPQTWGLFLYSVWFNSGQYFVWYANLPNQWLAWFDWAQALFQALGLSGILLFALYFPRDSVDGWRRRAAFLLWIPTALFLTFAVLAFRNFTAGVPTEIPYRVYYALTWVAYAVMFVLFLDTYRSLEAARPKIRWVILGAVWALGCFLFADTYEATSMFANLEGLFHGRLPEWVLNLLYAQSFWLPAAVFYAIRHYRVIKVRFAIARVLVFPAFVGAFAIAVKAGELLVEYVLSERFVWFDDVRAILVIGLGVIATVLDRRAHRLIEAVVFRAWHRAETCLRAAAERLTDDEELTPEQVNRTVVDLPVETLHLDRGALFRHTTDGSYELEWSVHWPHDAPRRVPTVDLATLETGLDVAGIVLGIAIGRRLARIALFGPHRTGEDLDRDEAALLRELARAAASAYERLEADALRQELRRLRAAGLAPEVGLG
jgi:hypothetical protein